MAWVRGFAYGEALGRLALLLATGVLMAALAKRTLPPWRR